MGTLLRHGFVFRLRSSNRSLRNSGIGIRKSDRKHICYIATRGRPLPEKNVACGSTLILRVASRACTASTSVVGKAGHSWHSDVHVQIHTTICTYMLQAHRVAPLSCVIGCIFSVAAAGYAMLFADSPREPLKAQGRSARLCWHEARSAIIHPMLPMPEVIIRHFLHSRYRGSLGYMQALKFWSSIWVQCPLYSETSRSRGAWFSLAFLFCCSLVHRLVFECRLGIHHACFDVWQVWHGEPAEGTAEGRVWIQYASTAPW